jgi:hypothetical protein
MGLTDQEKRLVRAIGQTMFPRDRVIDVDAEDVHIIPWIEDYLWRMPAMNRNQIRALLQTFDVGFGAWALRPGTRFAAGKPAQQMEYIEFWSESTTYTQRMLFEAIWCVFAFAFVEQAEAQGHVARGVVKTEPAALPDGAAAKENL